MNLSNQEIANIEADRDFWIAFIKDDRYTLSGFTSRQGATYLAKDGQGSVRVEHETLLMLGLITERPSGTEGKS